MKRFLATILIVLTLASQWAMATAYTSAGDGDWTNAATWDGGDTYPQAGDTAAIGTGHDITADAATITCTTITVAGTGTIVLPNASTRTITANITNNGTATTGAIPMAGSQTLTVNGKSTNTSTGYLYALGTGATLALANAGGTVAENTGAGRLLNGVNGAYSTVGLVTSSGTGATLFHQTNQACTATGGVAGASGNVVQTNGGSGVLTITGDVELTGAVFVVNGASIAVDGKIEGGIRITAGTFTWAGSRTLAAGENCGFWLQGGTLDITSLALSNSGRFAIINSGGGTLTVGSGETLAVITNQTSTAQAALVGDLSVSISGLTLPATTAVKAGTSFGFVGAPQTGTYVRPPMIRGVR